MRGIAMKGRDMTDAFKRDVRARMATTGEKYTQARRVLLAERDALAATPARRPPRELARGGELVGVVPARFDELDDALGTFGAPMGLLVAFHAEDLVFKAGLSPEQFAVIGGHFAPRTIGLPECLLVNDRSQWLGVEGANCGYPGTGPRTTISLLKHLGVHSEDVARRVRSERYLYVDLASAEIVDSSIDPITHIALDCRDVVGGVTVVPLGAWRADWLEPRLDRPLDRYKVQRNGEGNTLKHWCDEVLHAVDQPAWAAGPLRARCYLSYEAVHAAQLDADPRYESFRPTLVIEQGTVQLWCAAGVSHDRKLLCESAQHALELVGLPIPRENRAQQLLRLARRPEYIDIAADGEGLRHDPADLANLTQIARRQAASFPHPPQASVSGPTAWARHR
jgi:hypothetical protein